MFISLLWVSIFHIFMMKLLLKSLPVFYNVKNCICIFFYHLGIKFNGPIFGRAIVPQPYIRLYPNLGYSFLTSYFKERFETTWMVPVQWLKIVMGTGTWEPTEQNTIRSKALLPGPEIRKKSLTSFTIFSYIFIRINESEKKTACEFFPNFINWWCSLPSWCVWV